MAAKSASLLLVFVLGANVVRGQDFEISIGLICRTRAVAVCNPDC